MDFNITGDKRKKYNSNLEIKVWPCKDSPGVVCKSPEEIEAVVK